MAEKTPAELLVTASQAAAFRLARHHLVDRPARAVAPPSSSDTRSAKASAGRLVDVVRDTGGIQAQVMSAAEMALWTRRRETTRDEVKAALFERREIVKTSAMRLTLHLIPAADLPMVIAAMRPTSMAILQRWHARIGAKPAHVRALVDSILDGLRDGPRTQPELIARARKKASKGVRVWLDHAWAALRPAVIDGLIVCQSHAGAATTFVRADQWLPGQPTIGVDEARAELCRRFLSAFGPATAHDFARWSGLKTSDATLVLTALAGEILHVSVNGAPGWIRRADAKALTDSELDPGAIRLLGAFDSFLLAHATKEHLVGRQHSARVYRPQGWISPVVLRGGAIAGVWFPTTKGGCVTLDVELFDRATPALREGIAREAEAMACFLAAKCQVRFGISSRQA